MGQVLRGDRRPHLRPARPRRRRPLGLDHVDLNVFKVDKGAANLVDPVRAPRASRRCRSPSSTTDTSSSPWPTRPTSSAIDDIAMMTGCKVRPRGRLAARTSRRSSASLNRLEERSREAVEEDERGPAPRSSTCASPPRTRRSSSSSTRSSPRRSSAAPPTSTSSPTSGDMRVRFRIDGVLVDSTTRAARAWSRASSRASRSWPTSTSPSAALPQDGRVGLTVDGRHVDIRVATLPVVHGEAVVMRILDKDAASLDLDELGHADARPRALRARDRASPTASCSSPGPTGSGKTTTLYAALDKLNTPDAEHHHDRGSRSSTSSTASSRSR